MPEKDTTRIRTLFDRLTRVTAAEDWCGNLNPAQRDALAFLAQANPFSRMPSVVAEYLCTTRGTASQTLKALERKGLIEQRISTQDRRSISYDVTERGRSMIAVHNQFEGALASLAEAERTALNEILEKIICGMLQRSRFKLFGVCKTCRYHRTTGKRRNCSLLNVPLSLDDASALCHEYAPKTKTDQHC